MKFVAVSGLAFCMAVNAGAQTYRSGGVVSGFGTNSGFGSVVFPAGRPTIGTPFTLTSPNFANVFGNVVAGRPAYSGVPAYQGFTRRHSGNGVVVVPYAYPVFSGGYYGGYGEAPPPQQPNVTVIYPPQQTPVIIQQMPPQSAQPQVYVPDVPQSTAAPEPAQQSETPYYLLAFNDHSIYSAVGYWVDGDTLHYITAGNVHNQASVALIDRELTDRLNKGRGVQVKLPPSR
jgi:hypothetical protein